MMRKPDQIRFYRGDVLMADYLVTPDDSFTLTLSPEEPITFTHFELKRGKDDDDDDE
jgi:hypothetical protein